MKMVKSLLLGSAAGLVAVTAGQAADLPVKAKPVEYVKVCSLYGAGFYYMPGTDLCIKVGGWVRAEMAWGGGGNMTWGPFNGVLNNRTTNNETWRARGYITADVRNQTEYGTARGYIAVGVNTNDAGLQAATLVDSVNRAFLQWAGMTAGLGQSFFDLYSAAAVMLRGGYLPSEDTGDPGWFVWGYTAQLGNGFSATVSTEARRVMQIINIGSPQSGGTGTLNMGGFLPASVNSGANPGVPGANVNLNAAADALFPGDGAYGGQQTGDFVANLRLDQAWGSAQIMGALHEVNAGYYSSANSTSATLVPTSGHPSDAWGWAVGAGIKLNFPMIAQGDWFQAEVNATEGATRYLFFSQNTNWGAVHGNNAGYGILSDCVYGGNATTAGTETSCNLTSAWSVNASYEHFWAPNWHTTLYGAYAQVMYNTQANNMLCGWENSGLNATTGIITGGLTPAVAGCNNNWSTWGIGSRTQWDVTKTFYLGVEVLYSQLNTATLNSSGTMLAASGSTLTGAGIVSSAAGSVVNNTNQSNWMISVRAHRDFLP
jgi:hypothetical protein